MDDERAAMIAHALGHPARVRIMRLLAAQDTCRGAEVFAELPLAQSTISQHLTVLKRAGLVHATPLGTSMLYCITAEPLEEFADALGALLCDRPTCTGEGA
ncbi:MAG: metalloregulator ArsR/SmtB family transcription factor [Coriobacteriia bacterium]|nr:metalloregulator ArsR/SmtB family transcription factor [Coriobacteriia bacterium]